MRNAAQEIRAQQLGGLFVGNRGANIHRTVEEVLPEGAQRAYGHMVARLPVVAQAAELSRGLGRILVWPLDQFFRGSRVIESVAQRAALGKSIRHDIQEFRGSWLQTVRLAQRAIDEAARGLVGTATQERYLLNQRELLGKYEGYSPKLRALVQGLMPFLPWALNAARFVYWTMPAKHSALTALLVQVNDVVAKDFEEQHRPVKGVEGRPAVRAAHTGGRLDRRGSLHAVRAPQNRVGPDQGLLPAGRLAARIPGRGLDLRGTGPVPVDDPLSA